MSDLREMSISDILEERKCERKRQAEEKRRNDLKIIESINSKNDDGTNPLSLFPKELWSMISEYMVDHHDLENMRDTCTLFKDLLGNRRTSDILLSKALDVMDFHHAVRSCQYGIQQWLQLRSVCKTWRRIIDRQQAKKRLENKLSVLRDRGRSQHTFFSLMTEPFVEFRYASFTAEECLKQAKKLEDDYNHDKPGTQKRFFSEMFHVDMLLDEVFKKDFVPFSSSITKVLNYVGHYIWNFVFRVIKSKNVTVGMVTLSDLYPILVEWINLMPNIQCLEVNLECEDEVGDQRLDEMLRNSPFPVMKELKQFEIHVTKKAEPNKILEEILRSNQNTKLEKVILHGNICEESYRIFQLIQSVNLSSFSFFPNEIMQGIEKITRHLSTSWSLKNINLEIRTSALSFPELFRLIERYQTLETVAFDIVSTKIFGDASDRSKESVKFLRLPNLAKLKLRICDLSRSKTKPSDWKSLNYLFSIDYLVNCKKLAYLDWCNSLDSCEREKFGGKDELIQFKAGLVDFEKSNIWKVFPHMKNVIVRGYNNFPVAIYKPKYI